MPDTSGQTGVEHFEQAANTRRNTSDEGKYVTYETIQGTGGDGPIVLETRHVAEFDPAAPVLEAVASAGGSLTETEFFYAVEAVGDYGAGPLSNEESVTIAGTVNLSVDLSWNVPPGADSFTVYGGTVTETYTQSWEAAGTGYTDDGTPGTPT